MEGASSEAEEISAGKSRERNRVEVSKEWALAVKNPKNASMSGEEEQTILPSSTQPRSRKKFDRSNKKSNSRRMKSAFRRDDGSHGVRNEKLSGKKHAQNGGRRKSNRRKSFLSVTDTAQSDSDAELEQYL